MNILSAIADLPIAVLVIGGLVLGAFALTAILQLAIHFRLLVATAAAAITAYSQWNDAGPAIALPLVIGVLVWFVLRVLDVRDEEPNDGEHLPGQGAPSQAGGYDHCTEASRIEADYHRRQRENLFR